MTYNTVAVMARDESLNLRVTAAVATENILDPEGWLYPRRWTVASQPGWAQAWESAVAGGMEDPGASEVVITDGMILSAVQHIVDSEKPSLPVTPGSVQTVPHTHSKVVAEPLTTWPTTDYATFTDGTFRWDSGQWLAWSPPIQLPPQIIALEPASASILDADFEGHIRGLNFTEDSVIIWNGAEEPTRFIDSTDIWTTVVPSVVTAPTVLDVYVRNGDGQVSGIEQFTWEA